MEDSFQWIPPIFCLSDAVFVLIELEELGSLGSCLHSIYWVSFLWDLVSCAYWFLDIAYTSMS